MKLLMCACDNWFSLLMSFLSLTLFVKSITGPQLKVVSTMSVGYDHVSLQETTKRWHFTYIVVYILKGYLGCWTKKPVLGLACVIILLCSGGKAHSTNEKMETNWVNLCLYWKWLFWQSTGNILRWEVSHAVGEITHVMFLHAYLF